MTGSPRAHEKTQRAWSTRLECAFDKQVAKPFRPLARCGDEVVEINYFLLSRSSDHDHGQQAEQRRRLAKSAMVKLVAKDTGRIV
jgi:hypothetical protein